MLHCIRKEKLNNLSLGGLAKRNKKKLGIIVVKVLNKYKLYPILKK